MALGALTARHLDPRAGGLVLPPEGASIDGLDRRLVSGRLRADNGRLVADVRLPTTARPQKVLARASAAVDPWVDAEDAHVRMTRTALVSRSGRLERALPSR